VKISLKKFRVYYLSYSCILISWRCSKRSVSSTLQVYSYFVSLLYEKAKISNVFNSGKLGYQYALISSRQDLAGKSMSYYLKRNAGFESLRSSNSYGESYRSTHYESIQLYVFDGSLLTLEHIDRLCPQADVFIFLSRHKSDSSIPTLTCHFTGNFSTDNNHGGYPRQIAVAYPSLLKAYLKAITAARQKVPGYDVIIEATHHGPTSINKPVLFVELGSSEKQWRDENAAAVICETLLGVLNNGFEHCKKIGIALGGAHYPQKFNKLLLESNFALAAVASKHSLESIDQEMLGQMIEKSIEKVTHIILDNKGLGRHKNRILEILHDNAVEVYRV